MSNSHTFTFTDDELLCLQVCLQNAPTPYHISKKTIKEDIVKIIGEPPVVEHPPLKMAKYDLSKYGIND